MQISVLVATHNRSKALDRLMTSFATQDFTGAWEAIIVDNASNDDTQAVIHKWLPFVPLVSLSCSTIGKSPSLNHALAYAHGEICAFTDDDVEVSDSWLSAIVSGAGRHPSAEIFCGPIAPCYPPNTPPWLKDSLFSPLAFARFQPIPCLEGKLNPLYSPFGPNFAVRSVFLADDRFRTDLGSGATDKLMCEDTEFIERLRKRGGRVLFVPTASVSHSIRAELLDLPNLFERAFVSGRSRIVADRTIALSRLWTSLDVTHTPLRYYETGMMLNSLCGALYELDRMQDTFLVDILKSLIAGTGWDGDTDTLAPSARTWLLARPDLELGCGQRFHSQENRDAREQTTEESAGLFIHTYESDAGHDDEYLLPIQEHDYFGARAKVALISYADIKAKHVAESQDLDRMHLSEWIVVRELLDRGTKSSFLIASEDVCVPVGLWACSSHYEGRVYLVVDGHPRFSGATLRVLRRMTSIYFLCRSQRIRLALLEDYGLPPARVKYVGLGIDEEYFRSTAPDLNHIVSICGPGFDSDCAMRALSAVSCNVTYLCTEPPGSLHPLHDEATSWHCCANANERRRILSKASLVVIPTLPPGNVTAATITAEAMALGKAVITTSTSLYGDLVENMPGIVVVAVGDSADLRDKVMGLNENRDLALSTGRSAREFALRHFSLEAFSSRLTEAVELERPQ